MATYTVKKGDTLNKIANQYGYNDYKSAGLTAKSGDPNLIRPGETFSINPSATSPARDTFVSNTASNNPALGTGGGTPQDNQAPAPEPVNPISAYSDYLKQNTNLYNEYNPQITKQQGEADTITGLREAKELASRRQYENLLNQTGGVGTGFAQKSAAMSNRTNTSLLADIGLAESASARKLNALTGTFESKQNYLKNQLSASEPVKIGDKYYDPTTGQEITGVTNPERQPGIAGEYEYARSQGYTGSFSEYQNEDANRKVSDPLDDAYRRKQIDNIQSQINERERDSGDQYTIPKTVRNTLMQFEDFKTTEDVDALQEMIRKFGVEKAIEGVNGLDRIRLLDILKTPYTY